LPTAQSFLSGFVLKNSKEIFSDFPKPVRKPVSGQRQQQPAAWWQDSFRHKKQKNGAPQSGAPFL
jgi:hypothetical protein